MTIALKSFDIDSTYRDRNEYPNMYDFSIPIQYSNKGSTTSSFIDPILSSSPYTGSTTLQPGQLLTQASVDASHITLDSADSSINNFYINSTLQIGTEFRNIISYNGLTKVIVVDSPFSTTPSAGTVYYTRRLANYFNSNVAISNYDPVTNTVSQLNLLTASPDPTTNFYAGSYIRFTNGPHVGQTALITTYDPNNTVTAWSQTSSNGYNDYIPITTSKIGFVFSTGTQAILNQVTFNVIVFESVSPNRTIQMEIRNGTSLTAPLLYTNTYNLSPSSTQTNVNLSISSQVIVTPSSYYTITLTDTTSGARATGFVNLFGVDTRSNTSLISYNTFLYPYLVVTAYPTSGTQDWAQTSNSGIDDFVSTTTEQGLQFTASNDGLFNTFTVNLAAFESISAGRSLRLRIRSGLGISGSVLYDNTFTIANTTPTDYTFTIDSPPNVTSGSSYTLTLLDTTSGGTSTGYIRLFGISPDVTYVTNNINVYPKLSVIVSSVPGQTLVQQGSKLVGTGGVSSDLQGTSIDIDDSADTIISGAPDTTSGRVFIFIRSSNSWTQQAMLTASDATATSLQGRSVAISGDGNTVAFGGSADNSNTGAVFIFTRSGGVWTQQGSKLVGTGAVGSAQQGYSISLSRDGNTLAFGGYTDNSNVGAVWVFTRSGGVWTQQGSKLVGTGAVGSAQQGFSVKLSKDGNTLAFGGYADNSLAGAVWVFTRSGGVWTQQGSKLVGSSPSVAAAQQGFSVSLDSTGDTLAIGGPGDTLGANSNITGAAWIFIRSGGVWSQQGSKLVGTGATGQAAQGYESGVNLSGDGNILVVGGPFDNSFLGASWVFTRSGGVWSQLGSKLVGTGAGVSNNQQGRSVNVNYYGSHIISAGGRDSTDKGAVWIFTASPTTWSETTNNNVVDRVSTLTEQGYQATLSAGMLTNLTINLTSFETVSSGRSLLLRVRSGAGVAGSIVFSSTFTVSNTSTRTDYNFIIDTVVTSGTYTISVIDTTAGGTSTGEVYLYGITPNGTYISYNSATVYPRLITYDSTSQTVWSQSTNNTVTSEVSTISEDGWRFVPNFTGFLTKFTVNLTSFGTSSSARTLTMRVRSGAGVAGTILYQANIDVSNTSPKSDYTFFIDSSVAPTVTNGNVYTLSAIDISSGGTTTGGVYIYGVSSGGNYTAYNITTYPRLFVYVPSFIITISPPQDFTGFLNDNTDNIEFNSQAHDNASTLLYNGLPSTTASYYQIGLKYLVLPNQLLRVGLGGNFDNYPYVYVQLFNEGNMGSLKSIESNNPNSIFAIFKVPIDKNLYNQPTSFFTLKTISKDQIVKFRPDQTVKFRITLPDGTIPINNLSDNLSPLFPDPYLQVSALFTLLPLENYKQ